MELVDDRTTGTRERLPVAAPIVSGNQQTCGFHCGHEVLLHKRMRAQSLDTQGRRRRFSRGRCCTRPCRWGGRSSEANATESMHCRQMLHICVCALQGLQHNQSHKAWMRTCAWGVCARGAVTHAHTSSAARASRCSCCMQAARLPFSCCMRLQLCKMRAETLSEANHEGHPMSVADSASRQASVSRPSLSPTGDGRARNARHIHVLACVSSVTRGRT